MNVNETENERKLRIVANDLFLLCRRASVALKHGDVEKAAELLSHAGRLAARVGIKENILRTMPLENEK